MKYMKFTAVLLALVMAAGCSDKKKTDSSSEEIKGEPIETVSEENVQITENTEYSESNFSEIPVTLNIKKEEPPIEKQIVKLQPIIDKLGRRTSPCKADDVWKQYAPSWSIDGGEPQYDQYIDEILKEPAYANIWYYAYGDDALYLMAFFDNLCDGMHDWAIVRYDMNTEDFEEIFSFEGLDKPINRPDDMRYADGKLYFKCYNDDLQGFSVYSLDTEKGTFEDVFDGKQGELYEGLGNECVIDEMFTPENNRLAFADYTYDKSGEKIEKATIYELDSSTGKFSEIFSNDNLYGKPVFSDGKITYTDRNEKKNICVHTDSYTLTTDFRSADLVYADNKTVILSRCDYTYSSSSYGEPKPDTALLYVYDLESKTKFSYDVSELGWIFFKTKDGIIISQGDNFLGKMYYLIDTLGIAFPMNMVNFAPKAHGSTVISDWDNELYIANILLPN